jgi:SAM-dependent methyltransferase
MQKCGYSSIDWYDTPRYYDIVFDVDTEREADFLEAAFERFARCRARRVLEPACGSGRLAAEMARRGWSSTGFDLNESMLAYASRRLERAGLKATFFRADMSSFVARGSFGLAHCLVSTFKYLLDEASARSHLASIARALSPGGIYVLGFHLSDYENPGRVRERWVERRGGTTVVCNTQVWPPDRKLRTEDVRARLIVRTRARELRSETRWRFRAYDEREVRRLFRSVPELEHVATYDFGYRIDAPRDWPDDQLDCVFVLRKRVLESERDGRRAETGARRTPG